MKRQSIDLNADLGEGYPHDAALMEVVTSANICSGAYIASDEPIKKALSLAALHNVSVGIHVGYGDVVGFGRTTGFSSAATFEKDLHAQVKSFLVLAKAAGVHVNYLKPHGALYHDLIPQTEMWDVVLDLCSTYDWPIVHLAGSTFLKAAAKSCGAIHEGFIDRSYLSASKLVPRSKPNAVIVKAPDVLAQALSLATGQLKRGEGLVEAIHVDTLCLHGDTPGAVALGRKVKDNLLSKGIQLASFL